MTVFMMRSAHFRDHEGKRRFAGQFTDAQMPISTAQKAMRLGLAVSTADPRRGELNGVRGGDYNPRGIDVVDIDAAVEAGVSYIGPGSEPTTGRTVRVDPVTGTEFVETVGPAFTGLAKVS
jgi:hypothetical protein